MTAVGMDSLLLDGGSEAPHLAAPLTCDGEDHLVPMEGLASSEGAPSRLRLALVTVL